MAWTTFLNGPAPDLIKARRFDVSGAPLGGEFQVNEDFLDGQQLPSVAMRADGEALVTWYSDPPGTPAPSVRARRFCAFPSVSAPQSATVCQGGTASLSVSTAGRQPFSYQWKRNGVDLVDGAGVSGATGANLFISLAGSQDAGSYACAVIDACAEPQGIVSLPADLTVTSPPSEVADLFLETVDGGATLRFTWSPAAGASDYVVRGNSAPDGAFTTVVGAWPDPAFGLSVPITPGTEFYLVAARDPICGEGPLH